MSESGRPRRRATHLPGADDGVVDSPRRKARRLAAQEAEVSPDADDLELTQLGSRRGVEQVSGSGAAVSEVGVSGVEDDLELTQLGSRRGVEQVAGSGAAVSEGVVEDDLEFTQLGSRRGVYHAPERGVADSEVGVSEVEDDLETTQFGSRRGVEQVSESGAAVSEVDVEDDLESTQLAVRRSVSQLSGSDGVAVTSESDPSGLRRSTARFDGVADLRVVAQDNGDLFEGLDDLGSTQLGSRGSSDVAGGDGEDDFEVTQMASRRTSARVGAGADGVGVASAAGRANIADGAGADDADDLESTRLGSRRAESAPSDDADDLEATQLGVRRAGSVPSDGEDGLESTQLGSRRGGEVVADADADDPDATLLSSRQTDPTGADEDIEPTDPGSRRHGPRSESAEDRTAVSARKNKHGADVTVKSRRKKKLAGARSNIDESFSLVGRRTTQIVDSGGPTLRAAFEPQQSILKAPYRPRQQVVTPVVHIEANPAIRPPKPIEESMGALRRQQKAARRRMAVMVIAGGGTMVISAAGLVALWMAG